MRTLIPMLRLPKLLYLLVYRTRNALWFVPGVAVILVLGSSSCSAPALPTVKTAGLAKTSCWFDTNDYLPSHTCYTMTVDETPGRPNGRMTTFPVIVFSTPSPIPDLAPLLHLGGGGPGGMQNGVNSPTIDEDQGDGLTVYYLYLTSLLSSSVNRRTRIS